MAKVIHLDDIPEATGSRYPAPHDAPCRDRAAKRLSPLLGIEQFGVNLTRLPPGCWASQRHAHSDEDELVVMLTGTLILIDDDGEREVGPGDAIGHPAGDGNAHHLVNRSDADATYIVIGGRSDKDWCLYPDIGMKTSTDRYRPGSGVYLTVGGLPFPQA